MLQFCKQACEQIEIQKPAEWKCCREISGEAAITMAEAVLVSATENKKLTQKQKQSLMQGALNTLEKQSSVLGQELKAHLHPAVLDFATAFILAP